MAREWWRRNEAEVLSRYLPGREDRIRAAVEANPALERALGYLLWGLGEREVRGLILAGFDVRLRLGARPVRALFDALTAVCAEFEGLDLRAIGIGESRVVGRG